MDKIIECVPNFSEGRDKAVIDAIAQAIKDTPGCTVLDVDPGSSTNRTVYTFVGSPEAVVEGAFNAAKVAKGLIDMTKQKGEHPRFGAMDVCPFIPVRNATMDDCVKCARAFGERAGTELGLPIYMYEYAAEQDYRRKLPDIRQGEYEAVAERIVMPEWKPDFGPAKFVPSWGATAAGARKFLIAYNVNVLGTKQQAHRLALNVREGGRGPDAPGKFAAVKGIGWYVDEYNMAQVSLNLVDYEVTPMHIVYDEIVKDAKEMNIAVVGSEVVGVVPLDAMLKAAEHYMEKENLFLVDEGQKVRLAIERMGLSSCTYFDPKKNIIEYMIPSANDEPLATMSVRGFIEELGSRSAAPGGGSASALIAAMGAGLGAMVGWMTYGWRKYEHLDATMRKLILPLHEGMKALITMIDRDTDAFNDYMAAMRMPKEPADVREAAMQAGLKKAVQVPLMTMQIVDGMWDSMIEMAKVGNFASKSDAQVGAKSLETGLWGAYQNVLINLKDIKDEEWKAETLKTGEGMWVKAQEKCAEVLAILEQREE